MNYNVREEAVIEREQKSFSLSLSLPLSFYRSFLSNIIIYKLDKSTYLVRTEIDYLFDPRDRDIDMDRHGSIPALIDNTDNLFTFSRDVRHGKDVDNDDDDVFWISNCVRILERRTFSVHNSTRRNHDVYVSTDNKMNNSRAAGAIERE